MSFIYFECNCSEAWKLAFTTNICIALAFFVFVNT